MIDLDRLREKLVPDLPELTASLSKRNGAVNWPAELAAVFLSGRSAWPLFKTVSQLVRRLAYRAARGMLAARLIEQERSLSHYDFIRAEQGRLALDELLLLETDIEQFLIRLSSAGKLKTDHYVLCFDPRVEYRPGVEQLLTRLEELSAIVAESDAARRNEERRFDLDFDNDGLE